MAEVQQLSAFFLLVIILTYSSYSTYALSNGTIILYRNGITSSSYYYGIVRVYYNNGWGNICDDSSYTYVEANVICHQLGYTGVSSYSRAGLESYGTDTLSMKIDDLYCTNSNYLTIFQCYFDTYIDGICANTNYYDATVYCYTTRIWNSNPFLGMIRLQGDSYSNQGRVEVYCNGQWGTICNNAFDTTDARTICKQLGYNSYYRYNHLSLPGSSNQPIWSTYMFSSFSDSCYGTSNSCPSTSVTSCTHSEDVTIECNYISSYSKSSNLKTTCSGLIYEGVRNGSIILYRNGSTSSSYYYGIVRVAYNGWGNICDDYYYSSTEANVVCHQLGYTGASSYSRAGLVNYGTDTLSMKIDDLNCDSSSYLTIFQCYFDTYIDFGCPNTNFYDATVYCYTARIWNSSPFPGMIRLQGGDYSNQGRVEVYCNGQWGTICDNGFSSYDAKTICRQLGYDHYYRYHLLNLPGNSSQPIWSAYMSSSSTDTCYGTSNSCPSTSVTSCTHSEDVTVECIHISSNFKSSNLKTTCVGLISNSSQIGFGTMHLYRNGVTSSSYYYGIVQIYINHRWGNICYDFNYNQYEADVICHQLGYTGASNYSRAGLMSYGTDYNLTLLDDVNCDHNSYLTILQCSYFTTINSECTDSYDATVYCYTTRIWDSNPFPGMIRLQGGVYSNEGRVEVYCNGQWGTICDDGFDANDALVLCKQLGYSNYTSYNHLALSGNSSQHIWMSNLACSNSFSCLGSCQSCPTNPYDRCTHSQDVTLHCGDPNSLSSISTLRTTCRGVTPATASSNIIGAVVGGTIGSILLIIIVTSICCITVVVSRKYHKRQNANTQQVELQTIRSPRTTQTTSRTDPSRPLPNTTFNTIPQTQNQYSSYVTESEYYPEGNIRPPPPYNPTEPHGTPTTVPYPYPPPYSQESSTPYPLQRSAPPYESPAVNTLQLNQDRQPNTSASLTSFATLPAHNPVVQASRQQASNVDNCEAPFDVQVGDNSPYELSGSTHVGADSDDVEAPCKDVKTLRALPPPSYAELYKN